MTSFDSNGKGNLTFIKIPTPEETAAGKKIVPVEHCLELMNEGVSEAELVKAVSGSVNLWDGKTYSVLTRILVSTKIDAIFWILTTSRFLQKSSMLISIQDSRLLSSCQMHILHTLTIRI